VKSPDLPTCFLFDNGSLRAASTLNLRKVASALEQQIGARVEAVSLLHSSGVDAAELGGKRAQLLEPALHNWFAAEPTSAVVALPFFFGPSAALTAYLPERIEALKNKFPGATVERAGWLVDPGQPDERIASALADAVRATIRAQSLSRPKVVVVDHGSPQRDVAAVRDFLAGQVARSLGAEVEAVGAASMESRAGAEYAFNEPLLADRLRTTPFDAGDVVIALQFLSPGRHAGAGGDVAEICAAARSERRELRIWMTETIGTDPRVIDVLAERYRQAVAKLSAAARRQDE
jgi:sirohydrochlorin ferrochelatase